MNRLVSSRTFSSNARLLKTSEEFPFSAVLTPAKAVAATVKESKLANGVRIITRENGSATAKIKFAILGGSRAEKPEEKGAAHFLAASALSGNHLNSGIRMVRYFETLGATFKSVADREKITFGVSVLADKVDEAFTGLATTVSSPPYAEHVWEEDTRHIAHLQYDDHNERPRARVNELLHEAAYGEDAPLGGSLYALNLDRLDSAAIRNYRDNHFVADNLVVTATGISHDKLKALVESHIEGGNFPAAPSTPVKINPVFIPAAEKPSTPFATRSPYVGGVAKLRLDWEGESHVGLAFPIPAGNAAKPYLVLKAHLASKFGDENVDVHNYSEGGLVSYYTGGESKAVGEKLQAVIAELKAVAAGSVDVQGAKTKAALTHFLALEGEHPTCALITAHLSGSDASFGDVRGVSKEQVVEAAKAVLKSTPAYAVLGTTSQTPSFATVSQWLK